MEEDVTSVWSNLGTSMGVPSVVREELEKLRVELRDAKLEVARDIAELREVIASLSREMEGVVQRNLSLMTRLEGLESRAQHLSGGLSNEFNAFAYVSMDELEYSEEEENLEEMGEDDTLRSHPVEEENAVKVVPAQEEFSEWSNEDIVAHVLERVVEEIVVGNGAVLNNQIHLRYPEGIKPNKETKALLKTMLSDYDGIASTKIDKFRTLYYKEGEDSDEVYKRTFG